MPKQQPQPGLITVHGKQREDIESDLLAQIVLLLGRQLASNNDPEPELCDMPITDQEGQRP